jgi:hypothetical protein
VSECVCARARVCVCVCVCVCLRACRGAMAGPSPCAPSHELPVQRTTCRRYICSECLTPRAMLFATELTANSTHARTLARSHARTHARIRAHRLRTLCTTQTPAVPTHCCEQGSDKCRGKAVVSFDAVAAPSVLLTFGKTGAGSQGGSWMMSTRLTRCRASTVTV